MGLLGVLVCLVGCEHAAPAESDAEAAAASALCAAPGTPIATIQGRGETSPLLGELVTASGVVTGDFQGEDELRGFFLQDPAGDDDPGTSDALFVFGPGSPEVEAGERVTVRGRVTEFHGLTEIAEVDAVAVCGTEAVAATPLPSTHGADLEPVEGMLVAVGGELAVVANRELGSRGQIEVGLGGRNFQSDGAATVSWPTLVVDDGSGRESPRPLPHLGGAPTLRAGSRLAPFVGVVGLGLEGWVVHPTTPLAVAVANPRPADAPEVGGDLRVASANLHNYFITAGSRGALDAAELDRQRQKLRALVRGLGADLVAVQEAENLPGVLPDLAAVLAEDGEPWLALGDPPTGLGDDAIKVGFLYRNSRVRPVGPPRADRDPVHERPPVAQTWSSDGELVTVVAVHLKSKRCEGAVGEDREEVPGAGCFAATRERQATALARFVAALRVSSGDPDVLVVGDFNAYGGESALAALEAAGLVDLAARHVPATERYSYVFDGLAGRLDHAFATPSLAAAVTGVRYWHVNADEPESLDYRDPETMDPGPFRSSDHDPLLVGLDLD